MNENNFGAGGLILLKNPYILGIVAIIILLFGFGSMFFFANTGNISEETLKTVYVNCQEGNINLEKFKNGIDNAGVFKNKSDSFIGVARQNQIDPVLLASIAMLETGKGTSHAVKAYNNPGGLMNPSTGRLWVFNSLDEGLNVMARNLYKNYISQGLVTIPQIGNKYAPIGVANDPTNLNINWIPSVETYASKLGGLSMNCKAVGEGSGGYIKPVGNAPITSPFGYRVDPVTGAPSDFHKGVDFGAPKGKPILAAQGGKVVVAVQSGWGGGYGHHVIIDTGDKLNLYGHMDNLYVKVGQRIEQGQPIGTVGNTGNSTGYHLHFEVQLSLYGQRIDPMPFLGGVNK